MGDGIVGHISKGPIHAKVDALVNHRDAKGQFDKRAQFLDALINQAHTPDAYRQILETQAGVMPGESNYLRDTWYNTGTGGFFPQVQPIYQVLRQGLIKALQEAGNDLALDSYWIAVAPDSVIETIVVKSAVQVTRLIMTPISPRTPRTRHTPAPMWVVKPKTSANEVPGFGPDDEVVESVQTSTVTWQRRELP
ncbi:MAG TPA: hypothetical protein VK548_03120 [Candidatus Acidoferrum sp.]|nr:hypothetical protein [Candidatus Acidoferrum sp.]